MARIFFSVALLTALAYFTASDDPGPINKAPDVPPAAISPEAKALDSLTMELRSLLGKARDGETRKELIAAYSDKFLAHARNNPSDSSAIEALLTVLRFNSDQPRCKPRLEALDLLRKDHAGSKFMQPYLREIARQGFPWEKEGPLDVLRAVYRDHSDKLTRALTARVLIQHLDNRVRLGYMVQKDEKARASAEKGVSKEAIQGLIDAIEDNRKEADKYRAALKTDLKGILADVDSGEAAPETICEDMRGNKVKLSDFKGKVIVLDFWATWCPPCKAMIPHTRELVKKMQGKPFVFVSVSVDGEKATLAEFLTKTETNWPHWWDGYQGNASRIWDIESYPTIYVIDHKGIIRHKQEGYDPKSGDLEKIVENLVKTAEDEKASRPE